jgi:hypothetical protein
MSYRKGFSCQSLLREGPPIRPKNYTYFVREGNRWNNIEHSCPKNNKFYFIPNQKKARLVEQKQQEEQRQARLEEEARISRVNEGRRQCLEQTSRFKEMRSNM